MIDETEELEPSQEVKVGIQRETRCKHFFVTDPTQDSRSNMISVRCFKEGCWAGAQFDPSQTELKNGKLASKDEDSQLAL